MAAREDLHRLREVSPLSHVRAVRHGRSARHGARERRSHRAQRHPAGGGAARVMALAFSAVKGGVTTPRGFRAAGISAGIKATKGLDLALLVSESPATAAAVFTVNHAQAAPVVVSRQHLARSGGVARAIVVNSGCANACTGDEGLQAARGMAKGSGMIEPMMATMLAFVTTDAAAPQPLLARALREAVDDTFNAITVDGECSTNDCVMLLANGASGAVVDETSYGAFVAGLQAVCRELALGIVRGGEGATKLVRVTVTGGASSVEARRAAKAIANSPLVKTAIHGGDPNWGRLIAVAGRAGVAFELERAAVMIGSIVLFKNGKPHDEAAPQAAAYLKGKDISVSVDLGAGTVSSTVWTCDLSAEYVRINADYRT